MNASRPITVANIACIADGQTDLETGYAANHEYGVIYFEHTPDWEMTEDGAEHDWVDATVLGAVIYGDDDGEYAVPVFMDADQLAALISRESLVQIREIYEQYI